MHRSFPSAPGTPGYAAAALCREGADVPSPWMQQRLLAGVAVGQSVVEHRSSAERRSNRVCNLPLGGCAVRSSPRGRWYRRGPCCSSGRRYRPAGCNPVGCDTRPGHRHVVGRLAVTLPGRADRLLDRRHSSPCLWCKVVGHAAAATGWQISRRCGQRVGTGRCQQLCSPQHTVPSLAQPPAPVVDKFPAHARSAGAGRIAQA